MDSVSLIILIRPFFQKIFSDLFYSFKTGITLTTGVLLSMIKSK
ncbi:hypothetical protein LEP1GSC034_1939 [Leptospira interrogans str. 2003000735]|uniref:Uncharacterized protein n=4 Tax=Leptospira interrogans TaxID=173 RepID=A0A0E2D3N4_LEPIR|nr:hypothetical protein LEP1GSC045_2420 [Leptospira interrogans serovar Pomona str. Kennewicki LC82-25]EKN86800.1 hypothetical protein LEP1GSC027_3501 [Leptospira interrogans str. 2002000624]EKN97820.1 hypothetical protein LEP1GSC014_3358 [Leptospira interrogans serovar Pomona str. Pomona]EKO06118.1 hypothetical protein LEP1GSC077_2260 [Leptospira interrogans str. C10069]EKQ48397.1 hypothetical protein LEP1GSC026_2997 [Leptospira interrogans str. 2002000623]EKR27252.1 hypothetical protein LEP1